MNSHSIKQTKRVSLAKAARNARHKRLNIKGMESAGGMKPPLHFGQTIPAEDACCTKKRNIDSTDVPQEGTEDTRNEKKLKGVVGNLNADSCCSSYDSSVFSERPGELPKEDISGKEAMGEAKRSQSMAQFSCGSVSVIGRRRVMEDALTVAPGIVAGKYDFFAAYDGHGGARVAHACRDHLHHLLEKELEGNLRHLPADNPTTDGGKNMIDWTKVMEACFSRMDEEVQMQIHDHNYAEEAERAVGSTAVVVIIGTEELVVANCGDSRAVLCRGGVAVPLSNDHKPDRPDERDRVEAAGGRIINWDGCRVQGVLATSRSIGDHYLKPYVISKPEVTINKRTDLDDFFIIATDGLWDVMSNDVACEVVRRCLNGQISKELFEENGTTEAAAILVELAIAKGSIDNISVIVVDLKKLSSKVSGTSLC